MTSNLRKPTPTARNAPDLMKVLDVMRERKCGLRPFEIARFAGLTQQRADAALEEARRQGLIHIGLWRLTDKGKA